MILNPLLVQRLFELVASWLLRPSAMTAKSAPPMRCRRKTVAHLTAATTPILHPQPLRLWAACPAPRSAHLDQKGPWNHHLLSNHGISWASVHYLFFFFLRTLLSACFFSHISIFSNTTSSSKIYPKIQSRDFPGGPVAKTLHFHCPEAHVRSLIEELECDISWPKQNNQTKQNNQKYRQVIMEI